MSFITGVDRQLANLSAELAPDGFIPNVGRSNNELVPIEREAETEN